MKILLVEPPSASRFGTLRILGSVGTLKADIAWPPYDLMILAGMFKKMKQEVKILDALNLHYNFKRMAQEISAYAPQCVIFTTTVPTMKNDCYTATVVKEINPKILTCAVNLSMPSCRFDVLERFPDVDLVAYDEPELPLANLVINQLNPEGILGIAYRKGDAIKKNPPQPKPMDLDQFGIPLHGGLPLHIYHDPLMRERPMTIVNCSRGCKGICNHCLSIFQRPLRYRSVENVIEELRILRGLKVKEIKFFDCGLTNDLVWAKNFFETILKNNFKFSWNCNARADCLPLELLRLMKQSGCHTVAIGSESANDRILSRMKKNLNHEDIALAVERCRKIGMRSLLYFTFGLIGETEETMKESLKFALRVRPDFVTFGIVIPIYGTEFYEYLKQNNYLLTDDESVYDTSRLPPYSYPLLSNQKIYQFSKYAYHCFYLRPDYIFYRLKNIKNWNEIFLNLRNLSALLKRLLLKNGTKRDCFGQSCTSGMG